MTPKNDKPAKIEECHALIDKLTAAGREMLEESDRFRIRGNQLEQQNKALVRLVALYAGVETADER